PQGTAAGTPTTWRYRCLAVLLKRAREADTLFKLAVTSFSTVGRCSRQQPPEFTLWVTAWGVNARL
ncbi:unnamed protein product, partial [Laminaria digitata]